MSRRTGWLLVVAALAVAAVWRLSSGQRAGRPPDEAVAPEQAPAPAVQPDAPYVSEVPEGPGAAVALLVDCSGSMGEEWRAGTKATSARQALSDALEATGAFQRAHPDRPVKVGVLAFADGVTRIMPVQGWDAEKFGAALAQLPAPKGNTAIGDALDEARAELYRSGAIRKYILVITDGENTSGREPEPVARAIAQRSRGGVSISVVAVDLEAASYAFIGELGGDVLQANDPASLRAAVQKIYEGKILAEAADAEAGTPAAEKEAPASTSSTRSAP